MPLLLYSNHTTGSSSSLSYHDRSLSYHDHRSLSLNQDPRSSSSSNQEQSLLSQDCHLLSYQDPSLSQDRSLSSLNPTRSNQDRSLSQDYQDPRSKHLEVLDHLWYQSGHHRRKSSQASLRSIRSKISFTIVTIHHIAYCIQMLRN